MMRFPGFIGPAYTLNSVNVDCQQCINLYPEQDEMNTGNAGEVMSLVGTPGLILSSNHGPDYPIRGMYTASNGSLYAVYGNTVYLYEATMSTYYTVGTLSTTDGQVSMVDNGTNLYIVDGANGYWVELNTYGSISKSADPAWLGSNIVDYMDSYFIFAQPGTNNIYVSDQSATTLTSDTGVLLQAQKEAFPDPIVSFAAISRTVWLLGSTTTEVWYDAGNAAFPFAYIEGSMTQFGCAAKYSVAKLAGSLFWLGCDATGSGLVLMSQGYLPQRISTQAIEKSIQSYSDISDAIGFGYQQNGHSFYVITFPTGNATWVYDLTTGLWHQRGYLSSGVLGRHRANCYAYAFGKHLIGDYQTGKIYEMDLETYTDNGDAIQRRRRSPHISKDMNRIFFNKFQLDLETGVGIDGAGQGTSPQAVLRWSDDGGHTWSNEKWAGLGAIGETKARTIWRRLGNSRSRVFETTITDPVKVNLIGAELDLVEGES